ncbi:MAG: S8 family serine peptidase [Candidatus Cyclobacteriaceae bacterium M2_1C_046]
MKPNYYISLLSAFIFIVLFTSGFSVRSQDFIQPIVNCVSYDSATGNYIAYFGYTNNNNKTVFIPIGKENNFTPGKRDRGQPTEYLPGIHNFVFQVEFNGANLTWHLDSDPFHVEVKSATASSEISSCMTVAGVVTDLSTGNPLAGVNVKAKKGLNETTTSTDGTYTLSPVGEDDTLQYQLSGYFPVTIPVAKLDVTDVKLQKQITGLEPVFSSQNEGDDLWPELYYLADQYESGVIIGTNEIFQIDSTDNTVLIEVWANQGVDVQQLRDTLVSLGLRDEISGGSNLLITGWFPIENLKKLNNYDDLINFVRPVFTPLTHSGLVTSQADSALKADLGRQGFQLGGKGVKIGVLSDSYDADGSVASTVVANGDLPGSSNSGNINPVVVLLDNNRGSNEGMGMLEILHDVAPEAELGFRTGFLSPADMAIGITELADADYDIIVDDITYLTEPFRPTGQIAKAVEYASAKGAHYLTSAGNFGDRSYGGKFNPLSSAISYPYLPAGTNYAHDFGSGDIFQQIGLEPGVYVMELQWDDLFYSQNEFPGTSYDLDVWIVDGLGNLLYSGNRHNTGEDPIEITAFRITESTIVNVMITGSGIPAGLDFQYIIFRGSDWKFREHGANSSTVIGHASSPALSSVGAIFYGYTPDYATDPSLIKTNPYSSRGGNVLGATMAKPDFIAADGANTSSFGSDINYDADSYPNFFGSSAAAPHAAGVMALVLEAYDRFYDNSTGAIKDEVSTIAMRDLLASRAIDLDLTGVDNISGAGLLDVKAILDSLANPMPIIMDSLIYDRENVIPGDSIFTVTVQGEYLSNDVQVLLRGEPLVITNRTNVDGVTTLIEATVEPFVGNPPLNLYNPPKPGTNGSDGGYSDSTSFFDPIIKTVTITAVDTVKKYGEAVPSFEYTISPSLSEEEMALLPEVVFTTLATSTSDIGVYFVAPGFGTDPVTGEPIEPPVELQELYNFEFTNGALHIDPLPLTITPNDMTITYGDKVGEISFQYAFGAGMSIPNRDSILFKIQSGHNEQLVQDTVAVLNTAMALVNTAMALVNNTSWTISEKALNTAMALVNGNDGVLIDISLLEEYQISQEGTFTNTAMALVNGQILANGDAIIKVDDGSGNITNTAMALVNTAMALVNDESSGSSNDSTVVIVSENDSEINIIRSINFITGINATSAEEPHYIVPGAFFNKNFLINYKVGTLTINKAELILAAGDTVINEQDALPAFTSTLEGYLFNETYADVFGDTSSVSYSVLPDYNGSAGVYEIVPSIQEPMNYFINPVNGILYVNPIFSGNKIKLQLECTEQLYNDPSGYTVRAYFSYYNRDNMPWYIHEGDNNQIVGTSAYGGELPEVFLPGKHIFSIDWDGTKMNWQVYSTSIDKSAYASSESVNSEGCSTALDSSTETATTEYNIFPNPTQGEVTVEFISGSVTDASIAVSDGNGNIQYVSILKDELNNLVLIDLTGVPDGTYYIIINNLGITETLRVYKE